MLQPLIVLLQAGYYAEPAASRYSAALDRHVFPDHRYRHRGLHRAGAPAVGVQKVLEGAVPGRAHGRRSRREDAPRQQHPQREGHARGRPPHRPLQPADDDRQSERLGLFLVERGRRRGRGPRMRPRRAARPRLRPAGAPLAVGSRGAVRPSSAMGSSCWGW